VAVESCTAKDCATVATQLAVPKPAVASDVHLCEAAVTAVQHARSAAQLTGAGHCRLGSSSVGNGYQKAVVDKRMLHAQACGGGSRQIPGRRIRSGGPQHRLERQRRRDAAEGRHRGARAGT